MTDEAILAAQRMLWDRFRLIAEPGGATAAAALLSGRMGAAEGRARRGRGVRGEYGPGEGGWLRGVDRVSRA